MTATYDHETHALYIALGEIGPDGVDYSVEDECAILDMRADEVVGIDILSPPPVLQLAEIAARHGFAHQLDRIYAVAGMAMGVQISEPARLTTVTATLP